MIKLRYLVASTIAFAVVGLVYLMTLAGLVYIATKIVRLAWG